MARKKTAVELQAENRILKRVRGSEGIASVLRTGIMWAAIAFIFYQLRLSVEALAGQVTLADIGIGVKLLGNFTISHALAALLSGGGVAYGVSQNRLRKKTVERLQKRNQDLERMIDSKRSSSLLTPRGDTRPEDLA